MTKAKTGWLLPGILCLASLVVAQDTAWKKYMDAAKVAFDRDRYAEADKQLLTALKEAEKFGEQDRRLAVNLGALGTVYRAQGRYAEAEPLLRRALAIVEKRVAEKELEPEDPRVVEVVVPILDNLAALYTVQAKYAEAEPLFRRALAIREKALGPERPEVAKTLDNYAELLRKTNREAEAAKLEARAKAIRAKHAGKNPPK